MTHPANNLNQQIRLTLYGLKRLYGGAIVVYQNGTVTTDTKTGEVTRTKTATPVRRAVILPEQITREVQRSISLISADKKMVVGGGGSFESGKRLFVIERRDCPRLVLSESDWVVYNGRKYAIENYEEYEFDSAYIIHGKELKGESASQPIVAQASDDLQLTERARAGKET